MKVLIVDDDTNARAAMAKMLRLAGPSVIEAPCGLKTLDVVELERPEFILIDLVMPGMDGLTFLTEARKRGLATHVGVITGLDPQWTDWVAGADFTVSKPVDVEVMTDVLKKMELVKVGVKV